MLRRCTDWLQRLERGENVVVNLRPDEDVETEFVAFDRPRVVRVLERIAADLDTLSLVPLLVRPAPILPKRLLTQIRCWVRKTLPAHPLTRRIFLRLKEVKLDFNHRFDHAGLRLGPTRKFRDHIRK